MATLTRAHQELFARTPDECFDSFDGLHQHCERQKDESQEHWNRPQDLTVTHDLTVVDDDGWEKQLNDWSFSQLCRMAGVSKETVNRLSTKTASKVLQETLPSSDQPLQILATDERIRSVHGVAYTRLWNAEVLDVVAEFSSAFTAPQKAMDEVSTGLYCGEQDLFAFLIDPTGWIEVEDQAFAPGFFVWNSEVGRRSLGIQTFWFQRVCQNHLVWDAMDVVEFSRKHTANVRDGLEQIHRMIEGLAARRDQRRDGFVSTIRKAMTERLGDADEVTKMLAGAKIPQHLINEALEIAQRQGSYTIFSLVDALTQLSQKKVRYAGDRAQLDTKIGQLLTLAV